MPTASGTIENPAGTTFIAKFLIDDIAYKFTGNFPMLIPKFEGLKATLTYADEQDLVGGRTFSGQIGFKTLHFDIDNGKASINSPLILPVEPAIRVVGNGTWGA